MDLSTWLGIISIVISCIGLLVTVNKVSHRNSHNSNINGSFNHTKIVDKRKTIYENHNYATDTPVAQPKQINQDDDTAMKIVGGIAALVVSAILIFYYVKFRTLIIGISSVVMIVGVLTALLVVTLKASLSKGYKVYILLVWVILSGLIILSSHPIYPPDQLNNALSKFSEIEVSSAPKTLWDLHSSNPNASLFLTFQIGGLIMIVFYLFTYLKLIYEILANKPLQHIKTLIKGDIIFFGIIFVFISGAAVEFIRFLQNLSV
ncbi:hypothetical protein [Paenibacillus sp. GCM10012306]|uniref:hypothetical protein n=1 Tax=Paenibacillus sp. GCM10012306 TaxID=3317342 RepID=UPI003610CD03